MADVIDNCGVISGGDCGSRTFCGYRKLIDGDEGLRLYRDAEVIVLCVGDGSDDLDSARGILGSGRTCTSWPIGLMPLKYVRTKD